MTKRGHSYTIGGKVYPLTDEQFDEVLERDKATPHTAKGDTEFTEWLKEFVKTNKISPEKIQRAEQGSGYWYKGWGKTYSDEQIKLARVLQSMNGLISVMNPLKRPRASYAPTQTSYWMGDDENQIRLPVYPVELLDEESAVNVEGGFAVHEVHHSTETAKLTKEYAIKNLMHKGGWDFQIFNILEDVRIDAISNKKYPGTAYMLDSTMDFLSPPDEAFDIQHDWFEESSNHRLQAMLMATRYVDRWDATEQSSQEYKEFGEKVRDAFAGYEPLDGDTPKVAHILSKIKEIKTLLRLDDKEAPDQQTQEIMVCGYSQSLRDKMHQQEDGEQAQTLAEEQVQVIDDNELRTRYLLPKGQRGPSKIVITKPKWSGANKIVMNSSLLQKAKAALLFRRAVPQNDTRLQRRGELDEDELYRFAANDFRIFKDAEVAHKPKTFIGMMIDISGSMAGFKTKWAMQMAYLLLIAAASKENVKARVYAHTSQDGALFYRIWEEGDAPGRLNLLDGELESGANYDSYAVAWAGDEIANEDAEQKILLVISDGLPAEHDYGGVPAMDHIRYHVDRLERKGVDVIQIAIDGALNEDNQSRMYKRWIPFIAHGDANAAFSKTLKELTKVLERL